MEDPRVGFREPTKFTDLDHSYWRSRLPRGFHFYISRLARGFVRVQPTHGEEFAAVLMEGLLSMRTQELQDIPPHTYFDTLRERVSERNQPIKDASCIVTPSNTPESPRPISALSSAETKSPCSCCGRSRGLNTPHQENSVDVCMACGFGQGDHPEKTKTLSPGLQRLKDCGMQTAISTEHVNQLQEALSRSLLSPSFPGNSPLHSRLATPQCPSAFQETRDHSGVTSPKPVIFTQQPPAVDTLARPPRIHPTCPIHSATAAAQVVHHPCPIHPRSPTSKNASRPCPVHSGVSPPQAVTRPIDPSRQGYQSRPDLPYCHHHCPDPSRHVNQSRQDSGRVSPDPSKKSPAALCENQLTPFLSPRQVTPAHTPAASSKPQSPDQERKQASPLECHSRALTPQPQSESQKQPALPSERREDPTATLTPHPQAHKAECPSCAERERNTPVSQYDTPGALKGTEKSTGTQAGVQVILGDEAETQCNCRALTPQPLSESLKQPAFPAERREDPTATLTPHPDAHKAECPACAKRERNTSVSPDDTPGAMKGTEKSTGTQAGVQVILGNEAETQYDFSALTPQPLSESLKQPAFPAERREDPTATLTPHPEAHKAECPACLECQRSFHMSPFDVPGGTTGRAKSPGAEVGVQVILGNEAQVQTTFSLNPNCPVHSRSQSPDRMAAAGRESQARSNSPQPASQPSGAYGYTVGSNLRPIFCPEPMSPSQGFGAAGSGYYQPMSPRMSMDRAYSPGACSGSPFQERTTFTEGPYGGFIPDDRQYHYNTAGPYHNSPVPLSSPASPASGLNRATSTNQAYNYGSELLDSPASPAGFNRTTFTNQPYNYGAVPSNSPASPVGFNRMTATNQFSGAAASCPSPSQLVHNVCGSCNPTRPAPAPAPTATTNQGNLQSILTQDLTCPTDSLGRHACTMTGFCACQLYLTMRLALQHQSQADADRVTAHLQSQGVCSSCKPLITDLPSSRPCSANCRARPGQYRGAGEEVEDCALASMIKNTWNESKQESDLPCVCPPEKKCRPCPSNEDQLNDLIKLAWMEASQPTYCRTCKTSTNQSSSPELPYGVCVSKHGGRVHQELVGTEEYPPSPPHHKSVGVNSPCMACPNCSHQRAHQELAGREERRSPVCHKSVGVNSPCLPCPNCSAQRTRQEFAETEERHQNPSHHKSVPKHSLYPTCPNCSPRRVHQELAETEEWLQRSTHHKSEGINSPRPTCPNCSPPQSRRPGKPAREGFIVSDWADVKGDPLRVKSYGSVHSCPEHPDGLPPDKNIPERASKTCLASAHVEFNRDPLTVRSFTNLDREESVEEWPFGKHVDSLMTAHSLELHQSRVSRCVSFSPEPHPESQFRMAEPPAVEPGSQFRMAERPAVEPGSQFRMAEPPAVDQGFYSYPATCQISYGSRSNSPRSRGHVSKRTVEDDEVAKIAAECICYGLMSECSSATTNSRQSGRASSRYCTCSTPLTKPQVAPYEPTISPFANPTRPRSVDLRDEDYAVPEDKYYAKEAERPVSKTVEFPDSECCCPSPSAKPSKSCEPINVNVNVQLESAFDSNVFLDQVKQHISNAIDQAKSKQEMARAVDMINRPVVVIRDQVPAPQPLGNRYDQYGAPMTEDRAAGRSKMMLDQHTATSQNMIDQHTSMDTSKVTRDMQTATSQMMVDQHTAMDTSRTMVDQHIGTSQIMVDQHIGTSQIMLDQHTDMDTSRIMQDQHTDMDGSRIMQDQHTATSLEMVDQHTATSLEMVDQHAATSLEMVDQLTATSLEMVDQHTATTLEMVDQHTATSLEMVDQHTATSQVMVDQHTDTDSIEITIDQHAPMSQVSFQQDLEYANEDPGITDGYFQNPNPYPTPETIYRSPYQNQSPTQDFQYLDYPNVYGGNRNERLANARGEYLNEPPAPHCSFSSEYNATLPYLDATGSSSNSSVKRINDLYFKGKPSAEEETGRDLSSPVLDFYF